MAKGNKPSKTMIRPHVNKAGYGKKLSLTKDSSLHTGKPSGGHKGGIRTKC